jgi:hypothetical protein
MAWEKSIFISDTHGDLVCPDAVKVVKRFIEDWQPKHRCHLGDVFDFRAIRRGASPEERMEGISYDYNCGFELLEWYQPHFLTMGNHDHRLWRAAGETSQGVLADLCAMKAQETEERLRKLRIKWVPYNVGSYLTLPGCRLKLIHGFRSRMHPARAHFAEWGDVVFGHCHKPDSHTATHIDGGKAFACGTLADIRKMSYADHQPGKLGWRNSFLYGIHNTKTGAYELWPVIRNGKEWISPQGIL